MSTQKYLIAQEIYKQLHQCPERERLPLTAGLGMNGFVASERSLKFKVHGDKGINTVIVKLNEMDLYDIEFWDCRVMSREPYIINEKKHSEYNIHVENLVDTIWRNVVIV